MANNPNNPGRPGVAVAIERAAERAAQFEAERAAEAQREAPQRDNAGRLYKVGEILTFTGRRVKPLELGTGDIDPLDIAHALALQNRFTGHSREPYSVAQHCYHVATGLALPSNSHATPEQRAANRRLQLAGLLHDASEAYLLDLASPIKALPELAAFKRIEGAIMGVIEARFGFEPGALHTPDIKAMDRKMLATEAKSLMADGFNLQSIEPFPWRVTALDWREAERVWLNMFYALGGF